MSESAPLSESEREDLIAYLDGELNEAKTREMEAKLSLDPRVRAEADALRQAWEMLEYLPRSEPSPTFTNRTLERVTQSAAAVRMPSSRWRPLVVAAGWAAAVLVAGLVGFAGMNAWLSQQPTDEDLVRDLRLIEHKRLYEVVDDMEFLKKLAHPDLFGDDGLDS